MAAKSSHIALLLVLLAAACGRPDGNYHFVSTETAQKNGGIFVFTIPSSDSTTVYKTSLAARIVASRVPEGSVEFDIHTTAPDGQSTIERRSFPLREGPGARIKLSAGSLTDCEWTLHELSTAGHPEGIWTVQVTLPDTARMDALRGVGFSYETK